MYVKRENLLEFLPLTVVTIYKIKKLCHDIRQIRQALRAPTSYHQLEANFSKLGYILVGKIKDKFNKSSQPFGALSFYGHCDVNPNKLVRLLLAIILQLLMKTSKPFGALTSRIHLDVSYPKPGCFSDIYSIIDVTSQTFGGLTLDHHKNVNLYKVGHFFLQIQWYLVQRRRCTM